MNYPITRHLARYEYVVEKGYVTNKNVADIGGGLGHGSVILCTKANMSTCIDPEMIKVQVANLLPYVPQCSYDCLKKVYGIPKLLEETDPAVHWDVGVCVEVFEHTKDPREFVKLVAERCKFAFFTTPLVQKTVKTINPEHVLEYDRKDFNNIVGEFFDIIEYKIQMPDMVVVDHAEPVGFSMVIEHRVQMIWGKSKILT